MMTRMGSTTYGQWPKQNTTAGQPHLLHLYESINKESSWYIDISDCYITTRSRLQPDQDDNLSQQHKDNAAYVCPLNQMQSIYQKNVLVWCLFTIGGIHHKTIVVQILPTTDFGLTTVYFN